MLNSEVLDLMTGRLGRRSAPLIRTICFQELNASIRELERGPTKPWFLEDIVEGTTTADQAYIDLPSDFIMEIEDGVFEIEHEDEGWIKILKVSRERLRDEVNGEDPAFPEGYAIWGNQLLLGPTPDAAYNYRLDYYKRTSLFVDNSAEVSNPWLTEFFDYTTYHTLIKVARDHIQNTQKKVDLAEAFSAARDAFVREVEGRRVANETLLLTNEEN